MAANGYQKHILIGNLGANPKVNMTKSGQKVTNFDIAVNERNADGTEVVTWYGIAAWNGLGEVCAKYLAKGRQVMVEGTRMNCTAWFGRDSNLYTKMELTANEVKFLGGNGNENSVSNGNGNGNGNNNGNGNANGNSAHKQRKPQPQTQRQPQHQTQRQPQHQPQHQTQHQPQRQPQHAAQAAPDEWQHEEEYVIPNNPDEIPF